MGGWLADNFQLLPLGAAFVLLPGFVLVAVKGKFRAQRRDDLARQSLQYLAGSLFCFFVTGVATWDRLRAISSVSDLSRADLIETGVLLFGTAILGGGIAGVWAQFDLGSWLLSQIGLGSVRACVCGWDKAFERKLGCLVRIELEDGRRVFASYGSSSTVTAGPNKEECDCFFEEAWIETDSGELVPQVASRGLWIHGSDVKSVRLFDVKELSTDVAREKCQQVPSVAIASTARGVDIRDADIGRAGNEEPHTQDHPGSAVTTNRESRQSADTALRSESKLTIYANSSPITESTDG